MLDDELWELIQPLLPRTTRRYRHPGRRRIDDRKMLNGIMFVLTTGIAWQRLPRELGFGSGMTCRRRLRDWQQAGVWHQLHELLLARLRQAPPRLSNRRIKLVEPELFAPQATGHKKVPLSSDIAVFSTTMDLRGTYSNPPAPLASLLEYFSRTVN